MKNHNDFFARKASEKRNEELKAVFEEKTKDIQFEVVNKDSYRAAQTLNAGRFGEQVFSFVENWAKLMQVEIAKVVVHGEIIDPAAKKFAEVINKTAYDCYFQLGFMKLTDNQFAFAIGMMGEHWVFGKVLRAWYRTIKAQRGMIEGAEKEGL